MLILTQAQTAELEQAAIAAYPQECCGILLGTLDPSPAEPLKCVTHIWPTANAWTPEIEAEFLAAAIASGANSSCEAQGAVSGQNNSRGDRFWIDPGELLRAQKWARTQGWVIVGIYHSHPDHPAVPSERDRLSAWPDYSYVILSVTGVNSDTEVDLGQISDCKSWTLDSNSNFQPEVMTPESAPESTPETAAPKT